jgi:hypothetical protein
MSGLDHSRLPNLGQINLRGAVLDKNRSERHKGARREPEHTRQSNETGERFGVRKRLRL